MINQNKSKFEFDEVVLIRTDDLEKNKVNNKKGYIAGKSQEENGNWHYAVFIFDTSRVGMFSEQELESTGEYVEEDFNKSGETIKVVVNEKGEGKIKDID